MNTNNLTDAYSSREDASFNPKSNESISDVSTNPSRSPSINRTDDDSDPSVKSEKSRTVSNSGACPDVDSLERLQLYVSVLMDSCEDVKVETCEELRKILSTDDAPFREAVEAGAIPSLMNVLNASDDGDVLHETAWCITNIASGTEDVVMENGGIETFCRLLRHAERRIREIAVWALGNMIADGHQSRDRFLGHGGLALLKEVINREIKELAELSASTNFITNCAWLLSNTVRSKPVPTLEICREICLMLRTLLELDRLAPFADVFRTITYMTSPNDNLGADGNFDEQVQDRINMILSMNFAHDLVKAIRFHVNDLQQQPNAVVVNVLRSAQRAAGNILSGDDEHTERMMIAGVVPALVNLLHHEDRRITRDAAWALSNIAAGTHEQIDAILEVQDILLSMSVAPMIEVDDKTVEEFSFLIANALKGGRDDQIDTIIDAGWIEYLVKQLTVRARVAPSIASLCIILQHGEIGGPKDDDKDVFSNRYAARMLECGIEDLLISIDKEWLTHLSRDDAIAVCKILKLPPIDWEDQ